MDEEGFVVKSPVSVIHFIPKEAVEWDEDMWKDFFEELGCSTSPVDEWKEE